jgi:hypothetical protein
MCIYVHTHTHPDPYKHTNTHTLTQFEGQRYDAKAAFRSIADEWAANVNGKKRESINTVVQVCVYIYIYIYIYIHIVYQHSGLDVCVCVCVDVHVYAYHACMCYVRIYMRMCVNKILIHIHTILKQQFCYIAFKTVMGHL